MLFLALSGILGRISLGYPISMCCVLITQLCGSRIEITYFINSVVDYENY